MANENLAILKRIVEQVKEPAPRMDSVEKRMLALKEIVTMLDSQVSKEDFVKSFEAVLGYIKDMKAENKSEMSEMHAECEALFGDIKAMNKAEVKGLTEEVDRAIAGQIEAVDAKLHEADVVLHLMKKVKDGKQGEKGDKGDKGDVGPAGSPDMAVDIRNKLELLEGDERLDMKAIRGLEEELKDKGTGKTAGGGLSRHVADGRYTKGDYTIVVTASVSDEPANAVEGTLWFYPS
jgi:hypothetical protein